MFVANVRMRRVEAITKGPRWNEHARYKQYDGDKRSWMLADSQVHDTRAKALKALITELRDINDERHRKMLRLDEEIRVLQAELSGLYG